MNKIIPAAIHMAVFPNKVLKNVPIKAPLIKERIMAVKLMNFLREQGITVPDDISVAGFDDIPLCSMVSPGLTTVKQDGALRAHLAMEKLLELKEKKSTEPELRLPVSLVVRGSTAAVRK